MPEHKIDKTGDATRLETDSARKRKHATIDKTIETKPQEVEEFTQAHEFPRQRHHGEWSGKQSKAKPEPQHFLCLGSSVRFRVENETWLVGPNKGPGLCARLNSTTSTQTINLKSESVYTDFEPTTCVPTLPTRKMKAPAQYVAYPPS